MRPSILVAICVFAGAFPVESFSQPANAQDQPSIRQSKTLDEWVSAAKSGDTAARKEAFAALAKFGPEAIPALATLLKADEVNVRQAAAQALEAYGRDAKVVIPALTEALRDKEARVRQAAATALGAIGIVACDVLPDLAKLRNDENSQVRRAVILAMSHVDHYGDTTIPAAIEALKDQDAGVRCAAAKELGSYAFFARPAIPALTARLKDTDPTVRNTATAVLGRIGIWQREGIPELLEALNDPDGNVRITAASAAAYGGPRNDSTAKAISRLLQDSDGRVRQAAAMALRHRGQDSRSVMPAIVKASSDPDAQVRQAVATALGGCGEQAIPPLRTMLKDKDEQVRQAVAVAFGSAGPTAIPILEGLLNEQNPAMRQAVASALGQTGAAGLPILLRLLKDDEVAVRKAALEALEPIGHNGGEAVSTVVELLGDKRTQREAATALGQIGSKARSAVPALRGLLREPNHELRKTVIIALGEIGEDARTAVPDLIKQLEDRSVCRDAAKALGRIGFEAQTAIPALVPLLSERDFDIRHAATSALNEIGSGGKAAAPALMKMLESEEERRVAAQALGRIGPEAAAAVPDLIKALRAKEVSDRQMVAWALGKIGPEARSAVPALGELVTDHDVQWEVVLALRRIGPAAADAVPALVSSFRNECFPIDLKASANAAMVALGHIGPAAKAAVPDIVVLATQKDGRSRSEAIDTLRRLGPAASDAMPSLAKLMRDNTEDIECRQLAANVLAAIGSPAIPTLVDLLKERDKTTRIAALSSVGSIGPAASVAVPAIIEAMKVKNQTQRRVAMRTLGCIGPGAKAAVPALVRNLRDNDPLLRWTALRALQAVDPDGAAPAVTDLLSDDCREVREAAAVALARSAIEKPDAAETQRIKKLIADLANIDNAGVGYSPTMAGHGFAPMPSSERFDAFLLTDHRLKHYPSFTALVEAGPVALPLLLESLDDATPTKLVHEHTSMWMSHEIWGNPLNSREAKVSERYSHCRVDSASDEFPMRQYTVRVGDICFVAIGQITNRHYTAVRYQPSNCVVVNSPVFDKALAAEVRAIWSHANHRQELLESLLVDFQSEETAGSVLQLGAAMRLGYYYPAMCDKLLAARLDALRAAARPGTLRTAAAKRARESAGAKLADFVAAVASAKAVRLRTVLRRVFRETRDITTMLVILPTLEKEDDHLVLQRLTECLEALPDREPNEPGDGYFLLLALGTRFPDRAEATINAYLQVDSLRRCRTVVFLLRKICGELAIPILTPMLEDTREVSDDSPRRLCDEAAETIALRSKSLRFDAQGTREQRDQQIKVMREALAKMQPAKPPKQ